MKKRRFSRSVCIALTLCSSSLAFASDGTSSDALSLDDILNLSTTIATKSALTSRESPGIVSIVTAEEIRNSGARDMMDLLNLLVPGFQFGHDDHAAIGLAARGLWAIEGKVLVIVDGIDVNDEIFSNYGFGNRIPADLIEKVEIIRGPGSAIYGTYASLGVIRVTTKGADTLNGAYVSVTDSEMSGGASHRNLSLGFGKKISEDVSFSGAAGVGMGSRSDRDYVSGTGEKRTMVGNMTQDPRFVSAKVKAKDLNLTFLYDDYRTYTFDGNYYYLEPIPYEIQHRTYAADAQYNYRTSDSLTITPRLYYKNQAPYVRTMIVGSQRHKYVEKTLASITANWDLSDHINIVAGAETYQNKITIPEAFFDDGSEVGTEYGDSFEIEEGRRLTNQNVAAFFQSLIKNPIANLTVGGRYETAKYFGGAFVPRVAVTKALGDLHLKGMAAQSFRTPSGIQRDWVPDGAPPMTPEKAMNYEIEAGYRLSKNLFFQVNVFDLRIDDVIMYGDGYQNSGRMGSRGAESEMKFVGDVFNLSANYAYYEATQTDTDYYPVEIGSKDFVGFSRHRLNLIGGYRLSDRISLHPSVQISSSKFGATEQILDEDGNSVDVVMTKFDPMVIANFNVRLRDVLLKGLDVNLGVRNLLDTQDEIPKPYVVRDNSSSPVNMAPGVPVASRSVVAQLNFSQTF